ncbi:MAG: alpha/beta fold hydrolase [Anaerolineae bacterium]
MSSMYRRVPAVAFALMLCVVVGVAAPAAAQPPDVATNQEGDIETIDGVAYTHHFAEVDGLTWHYVEAGAGEPIVFLHGMPEAWYTWHYQMADLMADYRVIALDLKGFGQSDKADGDYSAPVVAEEIVALLDVIGLQSFTLVARDQGANVADYIAMNHPDRVAHYVRIDAALRAIGAFSGGGMGGRGDGSGDGARPTLDPNNLPDFPNDGSGQYAGRVQPMPAQIEDAETYVRAMLTGQTVQAIPEADIARLVAEFSRDGVAEAALRYYRDMSALGGFGGPGGPGGGAGGTEGVTEGARQSVDYTAMDFPVLLLQGESAMQLPMDEEQLGNAIAQFPDAVFYWVVEAGQFSHLEQPEVVSATIRAFLAAQG